MAVTVKVALNASIPAITPMLMEQFRIVAAHSIAADQTAALLLDVNDSNHLFGSYSPIIADKRFEPAVFPMWLGRKDVGLALVTAVSVGTGGRDDFLP